jgi:hypothetical protein
MVLIPQTISRIDFFNLFSAATPLADALFEMARIGGTVTLHGQTIGVVDE